MTELTFSIILGVSVIAFSSALAGWVLGTDYGYNKGYNRASEVYNSSTEDIKHIVQSCFEKMTKYPSHRISREKAPLVSIEGLFGEN